MEKQREKASLPRGWSLARIGDVIDPNTGVFRDGDWIESKDQDPTGEVKLIQLSDVGEFILKDRSNRFMRYDAALQLNCTFLKEGDILVARMPAPLGRACIFPFSDNEKYVTIVDVAIIRVGDNGINNKLLMYFINSPIFRKNIEFFQSGTTRKRISRSNLANIEFPVPPMNEQLRIVEKIDELFSELDDARDKLNIVLVQLEEYKKELFTNEFKKIKKGSYVKLEDICYITSGIAKGKNIVGKEVIEMPYLRVANVQDGYLDLEEVKTINIAKDEIEKYLISKGDILFTEGGDRDKLGRCAIWNDEIDACIHQNHLFKVRVRSPQICSSFISYYAKTKNARDYFYKNGKQTTNLASINKTVLSNLPVPLIELKDQLEIVSNLDLSISIYENTKVHIYRSLQDISDLKNLIMQKAYNGSLVEQFEDDYPAEMLLERIKSTVSAIKVGNNTRKIPESTEIMEKLNDNILDILAQSKEPLSAKEVWDKSVFKGNIEAFYAELKKVQKHVAEPKKGYLTLQKKIEKQ